MTTGTGSSNSSAGSGSGKFIPPTTTELDAILEAYEFIDILGKGGMGAVYKARQKSLDREVAIKILPPDLGDGDEDGFRFAERFQREARAMAKLSHPNIISVYDFGQASDGQLYIVMEFVEGTDLHELIRSVELTAEHVHGWTAQICDALQYAHNRGIIHRDIKPANVMISREGQVKIADFGLAKLTGTGEIEGGLTMTNMAMGTPDYIAPEALEEGLEVDHRADLYAVGVMLYEMLTGKVPRGSWKPPSTQVPGLDGRFDGLIEKAMDSDRDDRFQNAADIASTLYEISTTSAAPLKAGRGKVSLITGDAAATAAASGGTKVSEVVGTTLDSENEQESLSDSAATNVEPKSRSRKIVAIIGGLAALLVVAGLTIHNPTKDPPEVTTAPSDPAATAAAVVAPTDQPTGSPATTSEFAAVDDAEKAPVPETDADSPAPLSEALPASASPAVPDSETPSRSDSPLASTQPAMKAAASTASPAQPTPQIGDAPPSKDPKQAPPTESPSTAKTPAVPDDPRLISLEKGFQNAFERDANSAFLAGLKTLDLGYSGAIERARKAAQKSGALDDVVAFRKEQQRMSANEEVPATDAPGLPKALVTLRATYREAFSKLQSERNAATLPLYDKYLEALKTYETELTKKDAIEKALALRKYQKQVATRRAELVATGKTAAEIKPETVATNTPVAPKAAPNSPQAASNSSASRRELAEWLLTGKTSTYLIHDGESVRLLTGANEEIPKGSFTFQQIRIQGGQAGLTSADFNRLSAAPELLTLELVESIPASNFPVLRELQNLETLKFHACPNLVVEGLFADIASIPTLKLLSFEPTGGIADGNFHIPTVEIRALSESRSLEEVILSQVDFDGGDLAELAAIPTLKRLKLAAVSGSDGPFSLSALGAFIGHPAFTRLDLDGISVKPEDIAVISQLEKLEYLRFPAAPNVDDDALALLAPLGNLQELRILGLKASGTGFAEFKSAGSLRTLIVKDGTTVNDAGIGIITDTFNKLELLIVEGENFGKAGIEKIASLSSLKELQLRCSPDLTADAFEPLSGMSSLVKFHLANASLDASTLSCISELRSLQRLEITDAVIDIDGFSALEKLRNLEEIVLRNLKGGFHEEWIPALKKMKNLNFLYLPGNGLQPNGETLKKLREAFPDVQVNA